MRPRYQQIMLRRLARRPRFDGKTPSEIAAEINARDIIRPRSSVLAVDLIASVSGPLSTAQRTFLRDTVRNGEVPLGRPARVTAVRNLFPGVQLNSRLSLSSDYGLDEVTAEEVQALNE